MKQQVEESPIDNMLMYEKERGLSRKQIKELTAEQIVWHIHRLASDRQDHFLWEDCARWLDCKMREIEKLSSHLEQSKPRKENEYGCRKYQAISNRDK